MDGITRALPSSFPHQAPQRHKQHPIHRSTITDVLRTSLHFPPAPPPPPLPASCKYLVASPQRPRVRRTIEKRTCIPGCGRQGRMILTEQCLIASRQAFTMPALVLFNSQLTPEPSITLTEACPVTASFSVQDNLERHQGSMSCTVDRAIIHQCDRDQQIHRSPT